MKHLMLLLTPYQTTKALLNSIAETSQIQKKTLLLKISRTPLTLNLNYSRRPRVGLQARILKTQCLEDLKQPSLEWGHNTGRPHHTQ